MNFYDEKLNDFVKRCLVHNYYLNCDLEKKDYYKKVFVDIVKNNLNVNKEAYNLDINISVNIIENTSNMIKDLCNVKIKSYNDYILNVNETLFLILYNFISEIDNNELLFKNMKPIKFDLIFIIVFKILIYHELAHIFKGHILYKTKYRLNSEKEEDIIELLTLEYDADCFAFTQISEIFMLDYNNVLLKITNNSISSENSIGNLRFIFTYLIFSIHLLFFIFSDTNDLYNIDINDHPPMLLREIWAKTILEQYYHDTIAIDNQFNYFINEFNKYYREDKLLEIRDIISNNINKIHTLNDRIVKNWNENKEKYKECYYLSHYDR